MNNKTTIYSFSGTGNSLHIAKCLKEMLNECELLPLPVVLFANKVDLVETNNIDTIQIQEAVHKYNLLRYFITSAKTGEGVIEAFNSIIEKLYYKYKKLSSLE